MLSIVFNLKYLSQNFIKFKDQGQFWNPHDEQIPKLSLGVQFDQEIMEKTWETSCLKLTDHYCINFNIYCSFLIIFCWFTNFSEFLEMYVRIFWFTKPLLNKICDH